MLPVRRIAVAGSLWAVLAVLAAGATHAAEKAVQKGKPMSYREACEFLAKHTKVIKLTDRFGAGVAICPEWQGRVMTSGFGGPDAPSFGFVHKEFIEAGKPDARFNNYGGEERMWLSPEGGQFSLWFKPGAKQVLDNWYTAPAINEGAWKVNPQAPGCQMTATMKFQNASATEFQLDVTRSVRLLGNRDYDELLGAAAAKALAQEGVKTVGYETANQITNRGAAMTKEKGLVSIWILGMMNSGPQTVVLVPYRPGSEAELGPVVKSDYFGAVPAERLKVAPEAVLFRADAKFRSKIGTSQRRAKNVLGSIDFDSGVLTLVQFSMPQDPAKSLYVNNMWQVPQAEPYVGDVANSYNDGPNDLGSQLGAFYEIESLSPAAALKPGESLAHRHRTIHIRADRQILDQLAKSILGVDLAKVQKEMLGK
jgi:hypothetical protein